MFIEAQTIWKNIPPDPLSDVEHNSPPHNAPASLDKELEKWARRRIGVLFSMQDGIWTFIVLVGPEKDVLEIDRKGEKVTEPEKGFLHMVVNEDSEEEIANARGRNGGLVYCKDVQYGVEDMINYIAIELTKQGPKFLERIVREIFWGWGEFLKQMRLAILRVIPLFAAHSDAAQ